MESKIIYNYVTTNIVNGKKYVGLHSATNIENKYLGSGFLILKAIKKYGRNNFKKEIICICENKQIAHQNEKKYIEEYNSLQPLGYNISPFGGLGVKDSHTEESLKKMSENRKGYMPWNKGIKHTKEAIAKMKLAKEKYKPWLNRKHTPEQIAKIAFANSKRICTEETREKKRQLMLGRTPSEETRNKKSKSMMGKNTWSKGRKMNEEQLKHYNEIRKANKLKKLQNVNLL